jgi:predicted  nucleic acid-binding Zn-ribbon protein
MKHTQAELEFAFLHINQLETRISAQRGKITRMREQELPTGGEEEELAALLRAFDILKTHFETTSLAKFRPSQAETMQAGGVPAGHS